MPAAGLTGSRKSMAWINSNRIRRLFVLMRALPASIQYSVFRIQNVDSLVFY